MAITGNLQSNKFGTPTPNAHIEINGIEQYPGVCIQIKTLFYADKDAKDNEKSPMEKKTYKVCPSDDNWDLFSETEMKKSGNTIQTQAKKYLKLQSEFSDFTDA